MKEDLSRERSLIIGVPFGMLMKHYSMMRMKERRSYASIIGKCVFYVLA